ncbi:MAG TPA: glucokinase [Longimicrobiaceae bacterium]|nr:glucokinase [Longimicrobiaceae bacterium]
MGQLLLAGDIGGTKTDLAVAVEDRGGVRLLAEATVASAEHAGVVELASSFLRRTGLRVSHACFSVAGPVVDGRTRFPNLGWEVGEEELRGALGVRGARLVNDLQATALGALHLAPAQRLALQEGEPHPLGARAVIAPGTGLGEAFLVHDGTAWTALPSEGGHADFAPVGAEQRELHAFLEAELGRVSCERVCSGPGIANLRRFLLASGRAQDPPELAARIAAAADPTPLIVEAGLGAAAAGSASARALDLFAAILGAEAGNLALRLLSTGGVLVGGGIPLRLAPVLRREAFLRAFRQKGRMSDLARRVPVHLVLEPRTALMGAVRYGLAAMRPIPAPCPTPVP